MRKKIAIFLAALFVTAVAYAQNAQSTKEMFTGNDYLGLAKRDRVNVVDTFIRTGKKNGITIKNPPVFYCKKLDAIYVTRPDLVKEQFTKVLKTLIIMEYDWRESGVDKDKLARQWLGDDLYLANKKRLGR